MTSDILKATGGTLLKGREDLHFTGVSIDSRKVQKGELFVAIQGERFDGHDFTEQALQKGALGVLVRKGWEPPRQSMLQEPEAGQNLISVPRTLQALQDLAHGYRMRYAIPVLAVTGSNGKTSTKEMIYAILKIGHEAFRSSGNLNNHIGVPLSLLAMPQKTEAAVLEFGMSGSGEIDRLREIARPTVVVITNVSEAHMETLKSIDDVVRAKAEILTDLPEGGAAVLNADDPRVAALSSRVRGQVITFGFDRGADMTADKVRSNEQGNGFLLRHGQETVKVDLKVPGLHQVLNALAAAAAVRLGLDMSVIAQGLSSFQPQSMRWETSRLLNGAVVINDAYNANPASMKAAMQTVKMLGKGRRNIAVLGDMLELAEYSKDAHREIGRIAADGTFDILITVGREASWIADEAEKRGMDSEWVFRSEDWEQALERLLEILDGGDRILLKASRKIGLERIAESLKKLY